MVAVVEEKEMKREMNGSDQVIGLALGPKVDARHMCCAVCAPTHNTYIAHGRLHLLPYSSLGLVAPITQNLVVLQQNSSAMGPISGSHIYKCSEKLNMFRIVF